MKKTLILKLTVLFILCQTACNVWSATTSDVPKYDISDILSDVTELREENVYFISLRYKDKEKSDRTLMVNHNSFSSFVYKQTVRAPKGNLGFQFNGEAVLDDIVITYKEIRSRYFWTKRDGTHIEIQKTQYDDAKSELADAKRDMVTVPFSGAVRTYVLDKPLSQYSFSSRGILTKCVLTVRTGSEQENETTTKTIGAPSANVFDIDMPQDYCEGVIKDWDPKYCTGLYDYAGNPLPVRSKDDWIAVATTEHSSNGLFAISGDMSKLKGTIVGRHIVEVTDFLLVIAEGGREFFIPNNK